MEAASQPEQFSQQGFDAFRQHAEDGGPVVMLNLLRFRPQGGQERYAEYAAAVEPLLEKVGGRIVFAGEPSAPLLGEEGWDLVALVEYPSRQAFLEMVTSPGYGEIGHLRTEALTRGELHPMDPVAP